MPAVLLDGIRVPDITVNSGDCLVSIAERHGLFWKTVWSHPGNSELRARRKNPNVLQPGDVVFVPEPTSKTDEAAAGKTHRYRRKGTPAKLRVKLMSDPPPNDDRMEAHLAPGIFTEPEIEPPTPVALADRAYVLYVDGSEIASGRSDGDGFIEHFIPADSREATLTIEPGTEQERSIELNLGHMDPVEEPSGVAKRLQNLGYAAATDVTRETPQLQLALARFQQDQGLSVSGRLDDATRQKLEERHGG